MKNLSLASCLLVLLMSGVALAADGTTAMTPGTGVNVINTPDGSGNVVFHSVDCDHTTVTNCMAIKAASTAAASTDTSLVVSLNPNNAANSTAYLVTGTGGTFPVTGTFWQTTQPISAASLPLPTGAASAANQTSVIGTLNAGTAATNSLLSGLVYNSSPLTLTTGQQSSLQGDANGFLKVNIAGGGTVAQASTTTGQGGSLIMGAATTSPPSYTTAQTNAASLDLNGGLRTSPACNKVINIAQTATTDVHTFTGYGYICSVVLISATAQNIGLDEGTGTTCETSGTALIGTSSTSAATPAMAVAANGGPNSVSGTPWLRTQTSADHLCVLQSSTGEVAGTITYADLPN